MSVLRKIALGILLASTAAVLVMAAWELWNYRQRASLPLEGRMGLLATRVGDMELLVLILLGSCGLYAIVFAVSSYFSALSFARQADQTVNRFRDQIGVAKSELRALNEETERRPSQTTSPPPASLPEEPAPEPTPIGIENQIAEMIARITAWQGRALGEHARLELMQEESTAACLEVIAGSRDASSMAALYLAFGRIYASSDSARSRFYLERALRLASPESALASEIHYLLACRSATFRDFPHAMRELTAAFRHRFKTLDEKLANDIEQGGTLYELASTAPFDKAINDLLLNMSIGIG